MALTFLSVDITNPFNGKKTIKHRFLVDSGAVFTVVPTKILNSLGIKPIDKQEFILASGESMVKDIGQVETKIFGKSRIVPVVFGNDDVFLLGATTLESFGMMLDPLRREVKPLPMVM